MILQFSSIDYQDLDLARFSAWLNGLCVEALPDDLCGLAMCSGVTEEALGKNGKIKDLIHNRMHPNRPREFRTPLSDWYQVPFLIDRNEKPVSVANAWFRKISKKGSPKTWRTYAYALFDFFQYIEAENIDWQHVDDNTLLSYRLRQETTDSIHKKKYSGSRRVSKSTIQIRLLTTFRFYKFAAQSNYIEKNPLTSEVVKYRRPVYSDFLAHLGTTQEKEVPIAAYDRVPRNEVIKWLPHETVWAWINSIKNDRDKLIAKLLYQTGMRREEIVLLKIMDIPKRNDTSIASSDNWVELTIRGKGGKIRPVKISFKNYLHLRRWIDVKREKILRGCGIDKEDDHEFVWLAVQDGHPLQPVTLNHIFQRISEKCGIKITPHMLRHSFAMQRRADLYADGVANPEKALQAALGHSNVTTTMTFYGHISPQDEVREADSNAGFLQDLTREK